MQNIIQKYNIRAKKSLGQNFLVNEEIVNTIADALEVSGNNIIEVGPGYGALTEKLMQKTPKKLDVIELDTQMADILEDRIENGDFGENPLNLTIHNIDVLQFQPEFLEYFVIANIPYYITSPILRHFIYDVEHQPEKMLILMQKDVADKILLGEKQGKKQRSSVISLMVAKKYHTKELVFVGRQNFVPAPKVESSVLYFEKHNDYQNYDDALFLEFIKKAFTEPRKKLLNNLVKAGYKKELIVSHFGSLSLPDMIRGEQLDIGQWCKLFGLFHKGLT